MRRKRILLRSLGLVMFLSGAVFWAVTFMALLLNAANFLSFLDMGPFFWSLCGRAAGGLIVAVGGFALFQAGGRLEESISLRI
jgi:hypothetical protein